jgi:hypothetical protein
MTEGRRVRLSAEQRTEIWRRWKAGESLREIGAPSARTMAPFSFFYRNAGGSFRPFAAARCERSRWPSGKASHEGLLPVRRFVRSPEGSSGLRRR